MIGYFLPVFFSHKGCQECQGKEWPKMVQDGLLTLTYLEPIEFLVGGFKYFLFSSLLGEDFQFD